jgi:hypothetical protein
MKKLFTFLAPVFAFAAAPVMAFAQVNNDGTAFGVLNTIFNILNALITLLIILGVVYFIYGVITYVVSKGADDKDKAKGVIIQGLIGLFIIVAFWGIIRLVQGTFGLDNQNQIDPGEVPCINGISC